MPGSMSTSIRTCAIVPTHDHWRAIAGVVGALRAAGLPVLVIDDGSNEPAAAVIAALHRPDDGIQVHRLPVNQGKGVAVTHGMRLAWEAGYTHAVQIDADGQHDEAALPALLARSRQHPAALVSAEPIFDDSMPTGRRIGRWITHLWVWIETLSFTITDSMCGFRVYPLAAVRSLLAEQSVGRRMDFDTDIMVRLFWRGIAVEMVPARVIYPPGNTSNFRLWADNLRISAMHTRLVLAMLMRPARSRHWSPIGPGFRSVVPGGGCASPPPPAGCSAAGAVWRCWHRWWRISCWRAGNSGGPHAISSPGSPVKPRQAGPSTAIS